MPIPTDIRTAVLDLLRKPVAETDFDAALDEIYDRVIDNLTHETDLFAEVEKLNTVAETSIYSTSTRATRLLAVLHQGFQLTHVPSRTLDLLTEWETDPAGTPEDWSFDKLPLNLDALTNHAPEQFLIHPAPDESTEDGLVLVEIARPVSDDTVLLYLKPYLIYRTVGEFLAENRDEKDTPASSFWLRIAALWRDLIEARVPA